MTNFANNTLASIVTSHHQVVPVLEKYHLDFCCKGKRTLSEACKEKGLSLEAILQELEISTASENTRLAVSDMNADQLIGYILLQHHFYVKQTMPIIINHLEKVVNKHGENFPYMVEVLNLFLIINEEMLSHMYKEENILFPRIKQVAAEFAIDEKTSYSPDYINGPISVMEQEHDHAGTILYTIRELTNTYTPPESACTTFKVVLSELKEFEEDLHRHVHLENNILFPLANKLLVG